MTKIKLLFTVIMICCTIKGIAQSSTNSVMQSTIVEADGYAHFNKDKTTSEMRRAALLDAKQMALEMGQTHIQSVSKVKNFQLQYDLIESKAEGFVKILESKDYGITGDNQYHMWIKAEIQYKPKTKNSHSDGPLNVELWTDKKVYNSGDFVRIFLRSNKDCYVRVLHVNANDDIMQLLPNPLRENNYYQKEMIVQIPGQEDKFQLKVTPPFGREEIVVYASTVPLGDIPLSDTGAGLYRAKADENVLSKKSRGIRIAPVKGRLAQAAEFVEMRRTIVVVE